MEDFTKFTRFSPALLRTWYTICYARIARGGLELPPITSGPVSVSSGGFQLTRVIWVEVSGKIVVSVSTGQHFTEASFKISPSYKSTFLTLVRIRGGRRMTTHISRSWRRGGWSPWAAWRAWTRPRGWTSGMTPRLGLATGGIDGGVAEKISPVFLKNGFVISNCLCQSSGLLTDHSFLVLFYDMFMLNCKGNLKSWISHVGEI